MFGIYYVHPTTQEFWACTSGRHMDFVAGGEPSLYAQADNAHKILRDYRRSAILDYAARGETQYLATGYGVGILPGADDPDLGCFRVIPMKITPEFKKAIEPDLKKKK